MSDFSPSQVADLLGVSVDTVRRWCDDGRLATTRSGGGHRVIPGAALAEYLTGTEVAWEPATAMSQSARNRFTGIVTRVERDNVAALVELRAGPHRIVSLMTTQSMLSIRYPRVSIISRTISKNLVLGKPLYSGLLSGKCSPISPKPTAPRSASQIAWQTTSASE